MFFGGISVIQVKNLRSGVSRVALCTLGELFTHLQRTMDLELEGTVKALLQKAGESNAFIRQDVDAALDCMVQHCTPTRSISALLSGGLRWKRNHKKKKKSGLLRPKTGYCSFTEWTSPPLTVTSAQSWGNAPRNTWRIWWRRLVRRAFCLEEKIWLREFYRLSPNWHKILPRMQGLLKQHETLTLLICTHHFRWTVAIL